MNCKGSFAYIIQDLYYFINYGYVHNIMYIILIAPNSTLWPRKKINVIENKPTGNR